MLREAFSTWAKLFKGALEKDEPLSGSAAASFNVHDLPETVRAATGGDWSHLKIKGSAGQAAWTHTTWVALLDPAVTTSVQEGTYVVYLLSKDARRLYLSVNQGCTTLWNTIGFSGAVEELKRRGSRMRGRMKPGHVRFSAVGIDLGSPLQRARMYEASEIASVEYDTEHLPSDELLIEDLRVALGLHARVISDGGWATEDELLDDARADGLSLTLEEAKRYRQHRSIERKAWHAKAVKETLGHKCMGCARMMVDVYGSHGAGLIHAHHLVPLAALEAGKAVKLNPAKDFAVLCPNCHAIIHRLPDPSDVAARPYWFSGNFAGNAALPQSEY